MMKLKLPVRLAVGLYLCGGKEGTAREIWEALGSEGSFRAFSVQLGREVESGFVNQKEGGASPVADTYQLTPDGEQASIALIRHFQRLTGAEFPMSDPKPPTVVDQDILENLRKLRDQLPDEPAPRLSPLSDPPRYQSHPIPGVPGFTPAWKKNKVTE